MITLLRAATVKTAANRAVRTKVMNLSIADILCHPATDNSRILGFGHSAPNAD
jgi:hypothetical protein